MYFYPEVYDDVACCAESTNGIKRTWNRANELRLQSLDISTSLSTTLPTSLPNSPNMFSPRILAFSLLAAVGAMAESHTVTFTNKFALFHSLIWPLADLWHLQLWLRNCMHTTWLILPQYESLTNISQPQLVQGGNVLSTGGAFTSNGPLTAAIAYVSFQLTLSHTALLCHE